MTSIDWTEPFLLALRNLPVLGHAADVAGVDRSTAWRRMQKDEAFKQAVDEAMETGVDAAEAEMFRRAVTGWNEPVIHQGQMAYVMERKVDDQGAVTFEPVLDVNNQPMPLVVNKRSDKLLTFALSGRRKHVYAQRTEITGANGAPVAIDQTTRAARVSQLLAAARKRADFSDLA